MNFDPCGELKKNPFSSKPRPKMWILHIFGDVCLVVPAAVQVCRVVFRRLLWLCSWLAPGPAGRPQLIYVLNVCIGSIAGFQLFQVRRFSRAAAGELADPADRPWSI